VGIEEGDNNMELHIGNDAVVDLGVRARGTGLVRRELLHRGDVKLPMQVFDGLWIIGLEGRAREGQRGSRDQKEGTERNGQKSKSRHLLPLGLQHIVGFRRVKGSGYRHPAATPLQCMNEPVPVYGSGSIHHAIRAVPSSVNYY
jgi:hypothetical protein